MQNTTTVKYNDNRSEQNNDLLQDKTVYKMNDLDTVTDTATTTVTGIDTTSHTSNNTNTADKTLSLTDKKKLNAFDTNITSSVTESKRQRSRLTDRRQKIKSARLRCKKYKDCNSKRKKIERTTISPTTSNSTDVVKTIENGITLKNEKDYTTIKYNSTVKFVKETGSLTGESNPQENVNEPAIKKVTTSSYTEHTSIGVYKNDNAIEQDIVTSTKIVPEYTVTINESLLGTGNLSKPLASLSNITEDKTNTPSTNINKPNKPTNTPMNITSANVFIKLSLPDVTSTSLPNTNTSLSESTLAILLESTSHLGALTTEMEQFNIAKSTSAEKENKEPLETTYMQVTESTTPIYHNNKDKSTKRKPGSKRRTTSNLPTTVSETTTGSENTISNKPTTVSEPTTASEITTNNKPTTVIKRTTSNKPTLVSKSTNKKFITNSTHPITSSVPETTLPPKIKHYGGYELSSTGSNFYNTLNNINITHSPIDNNTYNNICNTNQGSIILYRALIAATVSFSMLIILFFGYLINKKITKRRKVRLAEQKREELDIVRFL